MKRLFHALAGACLGFVAGAAIAGTATTYFYDDSGNTTKRKITVDGVLQNVTKYFYDSGNRLVQVQEGPSENSLTTLVAHRYDANGNRVRTMDRNGETTFLVDTSHPLPRVIEEIQTTSQGTRVVTTYVWSDTSGPISMTRNGQTFYFLADGLGSTRKLLDENGNVTDQYEYDATGNLVSRQGSTPNTFLFAGEQIDPFTGLYYLRSRWMNPATGRFLTPDEFGGLAFDPESLHDYQYAAADPVNNIDPSGYATMTELNAGLQISSINRGTKSATITQSGRKTKKRLACQIGASWAKKEFAKAASEGHHSIPRSMGGAEDQARLFLPDSTHQMFHWVLNVVMKGDPAMQGLGNWSSSESWEKLSETRQGRKLILGNLKVAAGIVDKFCELKKPNRISDFIKKNEKAYLARE